jgi:hypothetical protein
MKRGKGERKEKSRGERSGEAKSMIHRKQDDENRQTSPLDESVQVENERDQEHAAA